MTSAGLGERRTPLTGSVTGVSDPALGAAGSPGRRRPAPGRPPFPTLAPFPGPEGRPDRPWSSPRRVGRARIVAFEPVVRGEEVQEPGVVRGQGWEPGTDQGAFPPGAVRAPRRGEAVAVELGPDEPRRRIGEWIACQQAQGAWIVVEQLPDQVQGPGITARRRHRGEPDLPIDPIVIGRDDAGTPERIPRLALELVGLPEGGPGDRRVVRPLEDDLGTLATDAAECAVGIHEIQP